MIIVSAIIFLVMLLLLILFISRSTGNSSLKKTAGEYKKIATENDLAKEQDFGREKSADDYIKTINKSISLIKGALLTRANIINYDKNSVNSSFEKVAGLVTDKKYEQSLVKVKEAIDSTNNAVEKYNKDNEANIQGINNALKIKFPNLNISSVNYKIVGDWALATISDNGSLPAKTFLRKEVNKWVVVSYGTSFSPKAMKTFSSMGAPSEITDPNQSTDATNRLIPLTFR